MLLERFWSKVEKTNYCWNWKGRLNGGGYGQFWYKRKRVLSHRIAYEFIKGKISEKMTIDHLCRNRSCVNPNHMEVVTNKENILRGISPCAINSKKTHCKRGHKFSGDNLRINTNNSRSCRECDRLYSKARRQNNLSSFVTWI
jgi:hypothetical protein